MEHCIVRLRDLNTNKIGTGVIGELRNMVLEENVGRKMVRENTNEEIFERIRKRRTLL